MIRLGEIKANDIDVLLHPYLQEENEECSRQLLAQLFTEQIDPVVRQIISYRVGSHSKMKVGMPEQQINDLQSEVIVRLLIKLRDLKSGNIDHGIKDIRGYAAAIAHNTCNEHSRRQNFQYSRLKDHLRYILINQPEFALWHEEKAGGWIAGFAIWRDRRSQSNFMKSDESPEKFIQDQLDLGENRRKTVAEQLALIFNATGQPVSFSQLIKIVALLRGVDIRSTFNNRGTTDTYNWSGAPNADEKTSLEFEVEQRLYLQKLWREICKLQLAHRTALLLNLIDRNSGDRGLIISLADLRIATMREIADCLNLSPEKFAEVWLDLPWDDSQIALHLGTTRRKVIRLRLAARKLLAKRMKEMS